MKGAPSHSNTEQRPLGWSQDKLSEFIESTRQNQFATFANMQPAYSVLREIDDCLQITAENLSNPKDILAALLLFRSHSAYRAACAMAMGTQLPETFVLLRSSLEYAGYALHISKHAELGEVWLRRHDDTVAMSAMKKALMGVNIENAVGAVDKELGRYIKNCINRPSTSEGIRMKDDYPAVFALKNRPERESSKEYICTQIHYILCML